MPATGQYELLELEQNGVERAQGCVHELFIRIARERPQAVAVVYQEQHLTYGELDRKSNQLARYLRKQGIKPEELIGLYVDRSLEMIVALLGILKAGAAYLPLDLQFPQERITYMLQDAAVRTLLINARSGEHLAQYAGTIIHLQADWPLIARKSESDLRASAGPHSIVYAMYTSGSMGGPKGVAIEHRSVIRLVEHCDYVDLGPEQVMLQFAPVSFDASTFEIWGSLLNGGRLVLMPDRAGIELLGETIQKEQVTTLWLTAGLFHEIVDHHLEKLQGVRQLLAGGDVFSASHVRRFLNANPGSTLTNGYGPTECTTFTCCHRISSLPVEEHTVPIGRPIDQTQVYVLDERLDQVDKGRAGELFIGGEGLARGYLHRPDLTAERFVPDPFSGTVGGRLYQSGDLVQWSSNGLLEFLGRIDKQVKIRGFRIELGDIEAALRQHPAVRDAMVVAWGALGAKRLIAYVVTLEQEHSITGCELGAYLGKRLPEFMLPSQFIFLEKLPLTDRGKVDHKALPNPQITEKDRPRTETEEIVAAICADVLRPSPVSLDATFLELGGSSLNATRAIAAIREATGLTVSLKALFGHKTLRELARELEEQKNCALLQSLEPKRIPKRQGPVPAAYSQERIWFIQRMDPLNVAYHFAARITFIGKLNKAALEHALSRIVERHEIYRTTLVEIEGSLFQIIHDPWKIELEEIDAENDPANVERVFRDSQQPFDLTALPLVRWKLMRISSQEHVLLIVEHHVIHDGWSFNVFLGELTELYRSYEHGETARLSPSPFQFSDFAQWQREWMETREAQEQLEYWSRTLVGAPPFLLLPYHRPRPAFQTYKGDILRLPIDDESQTELVAAAGHNQITLFMLFTAALEILLYRYSRQEDFCIGTGVANRCWAETRDLIGMLVNNIPLRARINGKLTVSQLMEQVKKTTLEAYACQDVPFDKIVQVVRPVRDPGYNPIFQVMFSVHDSPLNCASLSDTHLIVEPALANGSAKFDLNVILIPSQKHNLPPGYKAHGELTWEYNCTLFQPEMAQQMARHFFIVLKSIAGHAAQQVSEVSLLPAAEQQQILVEWNRPSRPCPQQCIQQLFEEQAEKTPNKAAVVYDQCQLTYAQLNQQGNQLAHYLQKLGVGPDVRVGICMERSQELVMAIIGVLKVGGAYVPLDPDYPPERLQFMADDSDIQVLLTQKTLLRCLPQSGARVLLVDEQWDEIARENTNNLMYAPVPSNLAYVIYTSGSTGKPKGAMITHHNVVHLLDAAREYYRFSSADVWTLFHSYTFDFSVWEIWGALAFGGRLVVVPFHVGRSPEDFYNLVHAEKVTVLNQTPSAFQQFLQQDNERSWPLDLRCVIFGGEALVLRHLTPWFERHKETQPVMVNMFGITETTVHVTLHEVHKKDTLQDASLIGRPIPNMQVYVMDEYMQLLPVGVAGEMYVGGAGLARGYLHRPDLTAEKFVPHPFSATGGDRLYRTGDRARLRPDGTLEYLGRIDHQIKIRGYRIELPEIEMALESHPGVRQAVILLQEDPGGERRLLAYLTQAEDEGVDRLQSSQLRSYLRKKLPEYMVPAAFIFLKEFVLTVNGKVDRCALPAVGKLESQEEGFIAPRTRTEQVISQIWSEVLNVQQPGANGKFFDLGGHSLLGIKVASRIRTAFQIEISLRGIFEHPILSDLATYVDSLSKDHEGKFVAPMSRVSRTEELPLSFNQEGRLLREWAEKLRGVPLQPFQITFGLWFQGALNRKALEHAINEIVRRHEVLRMALKQRPFKHSAELALPLLQGAARDMGSAAAMHNLLQLGSRLFKATVHDDVRLELSMADLTGFSGPRMKAELRRVVDRQSQAPFDYGRPPLMRASLLKTAEHEHLLVVTMHHMIADHWSIEVFRKELISLYTSWPDRSNSELPLQYVDFAAWQRQHLTAESLQNMVAYWRQRWLEFPLLDVRELPFISSPHGQPDGPTGMEKLALDALLSEKVQEYVRQKNVTCNVFVLAALNILVHFHTGKRRIGIWGHFANRITPEIENLIGCFANNHLLGIEVRPDCQVDDVLQGVRNMVLDADTYQEIPFYLLWMAALPERVVQAGADALQAPHIAFDFKAELFHSNLDGQWRLEDMNPRGQGLQVALYLSVRLSEGKITFMAKYAKSVFSPVHIHRFLRDWKKVLESMMAASTLSISGLYSLGGLCDLSEQRPLAGGAGSQG